MVVVTKQHVVDALENLDRGHARAIAAELSRSLGTDVRKRDINPFLYANPQLFARSGDALPIWRLAAAPNRAPTAAAASTAINAPPSPRVAVPPAPSQWPAAAGAPAAAMPAPAKPSAQAAPKPARAAPAWPPTAAPASGASVTMAAPRPATLPPTGFTLQGADAPVLPWPLQGRQPYPWQHRALNWWGAQQRRGIVEAVTGTGKTTVGLAAVAEATQAGQRVLLLVPSTVLLDQWKQNLDRHLPGVRVGLMGDGHQPIALLQLQVLVAVINSAALQAERLDAAGFDLLVADECHRYGAPSFQRALLTDVPRRLGLTATLERLDDGVDSCLRPYLGRSFQYSYDEAMKDRVLASFVVADVGIALQPDERAAFDQADEAYRKAMGRLINEYGYPANDFGTLMARATEASQRFSFFGEAKYAKQFVKNFAERRRLLAETPARLDALQGLGECIRCARGTLVFTETVAAAEQASATLRRLGITAQAYHSKLDRREREQCLQRFREQALKAIVCVKALDEGVDVPDADLGVILSASGSKRQMIQRLGRVVRKKDDGRYARFAILFAEGTFEDPEQGGHEAFRDATIDAADDIRRFPPGEARAAGQFLIEAAGQRSAQEAASAVLEPVQKPTGSAKEAASAEPLPMPANKVTPPRTAIASPPDALPFIVSPLRGEALIGSMRLNLSEVIIKQTGAVHDLHYMGDRLISIDFQSGVKRVKVDVGGVDEALTLYDPSLEVQHAALVLAMAARQQRMKELRGLGAS
jgi:superfamily II DNA or RNA helicase